MLRAFQKQLDILAEDHDASFEKSVRKRWGDKPIPEGLTQDLKKFVSLLPTLERRIFSYYFWLPSNSKLKEIGQHFLTYMYEPDDFIPENEVNGLFGYMDDAYLAALFYELVVEEVKNGKLFELKQKDQDLLKEVVSLRRKAKAVIHEEAIKIKEMLGELFEGDKTTFEALFKEKTSV